MKKEKEDAQIILIILRNIMQAYLLKSENIVWNTIHDFGFGFRAFIMRL